MPLYIRDDEVDGLAGDLQRRIGLRTKTEAVRLALEQALERTEAERPLRSRIAGSLAIADRMGIGGTDFDLKSFTDAMWDER